MTRLQQDIPSYPKQLASYRWPELCFKCTASDNMRKLHWNASN